jgi:hypothetical protein
MSSLQSTGLVLVVGAAVGFFGASALLPGTAATRLRSSVEAWWCR